MSDSTRLNIQINADNTAGPTIRELQKSVKDLEAALTAMGLTADTVNKGIADGLRSEIEAINAEIAARSKQASAIRTVTVALKEQGDAAAVVFRTLQENIDASFGATTDRKIKSASDSAKVLATSLSAAAEADARLRNEQIAVAEATTRTTAALERQGSAVRVLSGEQFFGVVNRQMGIGRPVLSAEASAEAFRANLGPAGGAITSIEAANFGRLTADLAGVKQSYLSAADSARVFADAGLTATERSLGMTEASVAAAARTEAMAARAARLAGSPADTMMTRNMLRHGVSAFDEIARGQRGALFGTIGAAARDAGLSVGALAGSMGGLMAIMAGGAVLRGASSMSKWATETRAAAAAAGMTFNQYNTLATALQLVGLKGDEADRSLRRLARSLSAALADPASKAAEAFHNLHISQAQLAANGQSVAGALSLLAAVFPRLEKGANTTANMEAILGRGFERLIPLLQGGADGYANLTSRAQELSPQLDDNGRSLVKTGEAVNQLSVSIRSDAIKAFDDWGGAIRAVLKLLGALGTALSIVSDGIAHLGTGLTMLGEQQPQIGPWAVATPNGGAAHKADAATANALLVGGTPPSAAATTKPTLAVAPLTTAHASHTADRLQRAAAAAARQSYRDFAGAEQLKVANAQGNGAQIVAIYNEWLTEAEGRYRQSASVIENIERQKVQAINRIQLQQIEEGARRTEQNTRLSVMNAELAKVHNGMIAPNTRSTTPAALRQQSAQYSAQAAEVAAAAQREIAALRQVSAVAAQGSATQKQAENEIMNILLQSKSEEIALYKKAGEAATKAAKESAEAFTKFFDSLGSAFHGFTSGMVHALLAPRELLIHQGLTTIKESMQGNEIRQAIGNMLLKGVESAANSVEQALGHMLASALSGGATNSLGTLFGNLLTKAVSSIFGQTAGNAVGSLIGGSASGAEAAAATAASAATISGSVVSTGAATVAAITANAATIVGAIVSSAATEDTLIAANAVKPSFLGFSYASGGIVPSAARGMVVDGLGGTLSILHPKEMVLPAPISTGLQSMISGGRTAPGGNANLTYAPTINANRPSRNGTGLTHGEMKSMLADHAGMLLGQARGLMRQGWRPA